MATLTSRPANRVREYETIYILRGDIASEAAEKVATRVSEVVAREAGKLVKVENWGRRKLAYPIAKQRRGVYTYVKFLGGGALVSELERNLRMLEGVVRYQTVLLRTDVILDTVAIDPEETKFSPLEAPAEGEADDDSRERQLGFLDNPEDRPRRREEDGFEDYTEESMNPDLVAAEGDAKL